MSSTSSQAGSKGADKGGDGVQHMLEGQDNRKLAGAKEALKKKILRLVMQEALAELGDTESLADKSIEEIGIAPEDFDRLNQGVRKHLIQRAATEVTEVDFDEIADAAAQAALDNSEVDEAAGRVEQKLLNAISEKALEGLTDDGATIKKAFDSIAEANAGAIEELAGSVQDRLSAKIAATAWSAGIDADKVVEMAAERIDPEHPSVAEAIERIQASAGDLIMHNVLSALSGDEATAELAKEVSRRFKERVMGIVTERVSADPDAIAKELEAEFSPQHESVVSAARKARVHLINQVRERALSTIEDARATAREAMLEIEEDNTKIHDATNALARRITQQIADGAMQQLGDAETAASAALKIARDSDEVIETATNSVYETMARHVAEEARERCADADGLADAARDYMDPKDASIARAVSMVQARITEMVANRALAALEENDRMRQLAHEAAKKEEAVVQKSVDEIREQIMDDIVRQVGASFADAGETARRAKARMGEGNAAVIAASEVLKELVLEELAKQATFTLLEPEKTGAKAFERIDTEDPRFQRTARTVTEKLIKTIAEHSLNSISATEDAAQQARTHISDADAALVSATAVLRDQLISEIARRGTEQLGDTRSVARQSRGRIEPDNEAISKASEALRELLINDMVDMTRTALEDVEQAAQEAMEHLNPSDEVFDRVRAVFKERVLINVLGEAMREIGQSVGGPNQEAAMFQQALHAMTSRDSARAGAWNGSGYQPTPKAPGSDFGDEPPVLSVSPAGAPAADRPAASRQTSAQPSWTPSAPKATAPTAKASASALAAVDESEVPVMEDWGPEPEAGAFPGEPAATDGWVRLSEIDDDRTVKLDEPELMESDEDMIVTEFVDHDQEDDGSDEPTIKFHVTLAGEPAKVPTEGEPEAAPAAKTAKPAGPKPAEGSAPKGSPAATTSAKAETKAAADVDMTWDGDDSARAYIYGYVRATEIKTAPPVDGMAENGPVRFVTLRGVRAIVSKVPTSEFGEQQLEKKSKNAEWVKERIRRHASVLDAFKGKCTVMPVRFGTVAESEADVAVVLNEEYDHIDETLDRLQNKQEWSLRILRDAERLSARIASSERTVEDSLDAISSGVAQFIKDEMDQAGELVDDEIIATVTENCIRRTHDALMPWAADGAQKALFTAPGSDMVFNAAYLVESGNVSDFKAEYERLVGEMDALGLTLELTGPWPAYHFVDADEDGSAELAPVHA